MYMQLLINNLRITGPHQTGSLGKSMKKLLKSVPDTNLKIELDKNTQY